MRLITLLPVLLLLTLLSSCQDKTIRIALNPWPGYEYLYLAQEVGIFDEVGLNIEMVEVNSLSDAKRALMLGQVDGIASTLIEVVQVAATQKQALNVVLLTDYSNGGDVIIAKKSIKSLADLRGKNIGVETQALGVYMASRALQLAGLGLNDASLIHTEQYQGAEQLKAGAIDAFVSYPPYSFDALKLDDTYKLFNSSEIPGEILDLVVMKSDVLQQRPDFVKKLHLAWQKSLDYATNYREKAYKIMADREGISSEEFSDVMSDLKMIRGDEQTQYLGDIKTLQDMQTLVCETLNATSKLSASCHDISTYINYNQ